MISVKQVAPGRECQPDDTEDQCLYWSRPYRNKAYGDTHDESGGCAEKCKLAEPVFLSVPVHDKPYGE